MTIDKLIKECNITKYASDLHPGDLYLKFRYYKAMQNLAAYNGVNCDREN